jgi:hypothetical protein
MDSATQLRLKAGSLGDLVRALGLEASEGFDGKVVPLGAAEAAGVERVAAADGRRSVGDAALDTGVDGVGAGVSVAEAEGETYSMAPAKTAVAARQAVRMAVHFIVEVACTGTD